MCAADFDQIEPIRGAKIALDHLKAKTGAKISKPDMCKKIGAVALIDDSLDYAKQCAAAGLPVFLFGDYPWNETAEPLDQRITRVGTWRMVAQLVSPATVGVN